MSRGKRCARIDLNSQELRVLQKQQGSRSIGQGLHRRVTTLLDGYAGVPILVSARCLGCTPKTVSRWRNRFMGSLAELREFEKGQEGKGVSDKELWGRMVELLTDRPRSGKPPQISPGAVQQIVALACRKPQDFGHPRSSWTYDLIAQVAVEQGIVEHLSGRYTGELLKKTAPASA